MSIPLDRLYHYLDNISNSDILIYRWSPHGSKKLKDVSLIKHFNFTLVEGYVAPGMICHDQEPLNYNLYSKNDFINELSRRRNLLNQHNVPTINDKFYEVFAESHLRVCQDNILNINDYTLLCHSEKNSNDLQLYEENWFIGVYYWCHGLIARDWFRYAKHDDVLTPKFDNIKTDFLIYNRAWSGTREYRLKFIELLINNSLVSDCNVKFNPYDSSTHYKDYKFTNKKFQIADIDINDTIALNTVDSHASADYNNSDYTTSAIEVVLETLFDDTRHHLTEKILRPIACGRPFILASTPGALAYLRAYGFRTFNGLINESYDTIVDPVERLEALVAELKRISLLPKDQKLMLWEELYSIAAYNKKRFFSDEFHNDIVSEFKANLASALVKCRANITGRWFKLLDTPGIVLTKEEHKLIKEVKPELQLLIDLSTRQSHSSPGSDSENC